MWRIEMLGGLRVCQDNRIITQFPTRKAAALLARLAYFPSPHPRELLMDSLWPESEMEAARQSLRQAKHSLRKALEPTARPGQEVLCGDNSHLWLRSEEVVTDVALFERALQEAEKAASPEERIEHLAQALDLYGGELLPGFYEEWIETERRCLEAAYLRALRQIIPLLEESGDPLRAAQYEARAVAADFIAEEAQEQYDSLDRLLREQTPGKSLPVLPTQSESIGENSDMIPAADDLRETANAADSSVTRGEPAFSSPSPVATPHWQTRVRRPLRRLLPAALSVGLVVMSVFYFWPRPRVGSPRLSSQPSPTRPSLDSEDFESHLRRLIALHDNGTQRETSAERQTRLRAHANECLGIAEMGWNARYGPEEQVWIQRIDELHGDMEAALGWLRDNDSEGLLQLSGALTGYWGRNNKMEEGRLWQEQALTQGENSVSLYKARVLTEVALFTWNTGNRNIAAPRLEQAFHIYSENKDAEGLAHVQRRRALIANARALPQKAFQLYQDALERFKQLGDERGQAATLSNLCELSGAPYPGQNAHLFILDCAQQSLEKFRKIGNEAGASGAMQSYEDHLARLKRDDLPQLRAQWRSWGLALVEEYRKQIEWEKRRNRPIENWHLKRLQLAFEVNDNRSLAEELAWLAVDQTSWRETEKGKIRRLHLFGAYLKLAESLPSPPLSGERVAYMRTWFPKAWNIDAKRIAACIAQGRKMPMAQIVKEAPPE